MIQQVAVIIWDYRCIVWDYNRIVSTEKGKTVKGHSSLKHCVNRGQKIRVHGWLNTRRWFDVVDFLQEQKRLKLYLEEIICISGLSGKQ